MANIKQQKKRIRLAAKQRLRNRHAKSSLKTLFKQLEDEVDEQQGEEAAKTATFLTSRIDKAAAKGILHKNNAAHKKSRVAHTWRASLPDGAVDMTTKRAGRVRPARFVVPCSDLARAPTPASSLLLAPAVPYVSSRASASSTTRRSASLTPPTDSSVTGARPRRPASASPAPGRRGQSGAGRSARAAPAASWP